MQPVGSIVRTWNATQEQDLIQAAVDARQNAYCPYSNYQVGASLLGPENQVYRGCNVENAGYGNTICAERHAIGNGIVAGSKVFKAVVVASHDGQATPCGACRQSLNEFGPNMVVIMVTPEGTVKSVATLAQLLPNAFGPHNLK